MSTGTILGIILVLLAGMGTGTVAWPMKAAKRFKFEHSWFVGMSVGLIIIPWAVTLLFCPDAITAYSSVDRSVLIKSNLFALAWGIANVLYGICVMRIGAALTGAILSGFGVAVGVTLPMIIKGTGLFQNAPDVTSPAGMIAMIGVVVIVAGVVLVSIAGFGRDQVLKSQQAKNSGFLSGLIMSIIAGIASSGIGLSFVYSQGPIIEAMKSHGAGDVPATMAVWAAGIFGGALVNVLFPAYLMTRDRTWGVLASGREVGLAAMIGIQFIAAIVLLGKGMVFLGPLGASAGFGIQQAMQIMGNQAVGFASGEWRGVGGRPRIQMYAAITVLIIAAMILAYGNTLAKS